MIVAAKHDILKQLQGFVTQRRCLSWLRKLFWIETSQNRSTSPIPSARKREKALKLFKLTFPLNYCPKASLWLGLLSTAQSKNVPRVYLISFFLPEKRERIFVIGFLFDRRPSGAILSEPSWESFVENMLICFGLWRQNLFSFSFFFMFVCASPGLVQPNEKNVFIRHGEKLVIYIEGEGYLLFP